MKTYLFLLLMSLFLGTKRDCPCNLFPGQEMKFQFDPMDIDLSALSIGMEILTKSNGSVVVNGNLVIEDGAEGTAIIQQIHKQGKSVQLVIAMKSVRSLDNQWISLYSHPVLVNLIKEKKQPQLSKQFNLTAYVTQKVTINPKFSKK